MPIFSARVPTGKLAGDVFVVQAPTEEALVQDSDDMLSFSSACCGGAKQNKGKDGALVTTSFTASTAEEDYSWTNVSCKFDEWLTPIPQVVGRDVETKEKNANNTSNEDK